ARLLKAAGKNCRRTADSAKGEGQMPLLAGRVAIVTGAGRGLGREEALALAAEGARVIINDIGVSVGGEGNDQTPAAAVVAEIKAAGGEAVTNYEDIATWDGARRTVD